MQRSCGSHSVEDWVRVRGRRQNAEDVANQGVTTVTAASAEPHGSVRGRRVALRHLLAGALGVLTVPVGGCTWPVRGGTGAAPEVYVGLARERAIAMLDPVTERIVGRISLEA